MTEALIAKGAGPYDSRISHGLGGDVKGWSHTVEVTAAAAAGSTYDLGYVPSNARILGISKASWDDMAASGSPTLSIGLFPVDSNTSTSLATALASAKDISAAGSANLPADIANYGKHAWELLGLSADPKGSLLVRATTAAAAADTGGTLTAELYFLVP